MSSHSCTVRRRLIAYMAASLTFARLHVVTAEQAEFCAPTYVVGHSIGEYMAAVASGVLDMPTAMKLVCER